MDAVRFAPREGVDPTEPCCRCGSSGCRWDRLGRMPLCPDCQERLAQGRGAPLVAATERRPCAVCGHAAVLPFFTFPLGSPCCVTADLCPEHVRALLGRRLDARAFRSLRRAFRALGLSTRNVFLLHEAFYDDIGRALQPVAV